MSRLHQRLGRLRDLVLVLVTSVALILCALLLAGRIWFSALVFTALGPRTLPLAIVLGLLAVVTGLLYVLSKPPCQERAPRGISPIGSDGHSDSMEG